MILNLLGIKVSEGSNLALFINFLSGRGLERYDFIIVPEEDTAFVQGSQENFLQLQSVANGLLPKRWNLTQGKIGYEYILQSPYKIFYLCWENPDVTEETVLRTVRRLTGGIGGKGIVSEMDVVSAMDCSYTQTLLLLNRLVDHEKIDHIPGFRGMGMQYAIFEEEEEKTGKLVDSG